VREYGKYVLNVNIGCGQKPLAAVKKLLRAASGFHVCLVFCEHLFLTRAGFPKPLLKLSMLSVNFCMGNGGFRPFPMRLEIDRSVNQRLPMRK